MQKIVPHLWFENHAEEAMKLYTSAFAGSKIARLDRIPAGPGQGNAVCEFQLEGQDFVAFDAGPYFKFSPAVSFFVTCETPADVDRVWNALSDGGNALMPLDTYPFSERFGWLEDRFGVSWQLSVRTQPYTITPALMFIGDQHGKAEEAVNFYVSQFDDARVDHILRWGEGEGEPEGTVKLANFTLAGQPFMAMENSHPHPFEFTGAISFLVNCHSQPEVDRFWETLSDGGEIQQCGWLKDRYGVYWQIVPTVLGQLMRDDDPAKTKAVFDAMLEMEKLDIEQLQRAHANA